MVEHRVNINWRRKDPDFKYDTFNRTYDINFSGGAHTQASNPREYFGNPELPNPEELLVSAVASCYMLTFLAVACKQGFVLDRYTDDAKGVAGKNNEGRNCITEITLAPKVQFSGEPPDKATLEAMQDKAHKHCFISNSVTATINIEMKVD